MTKNQHDNIGNYFVTRPIFASVIALFMLVVGAVSYFLLPVAQYPEVAPPTVNVRAAYPGANAETVAKTVATPLEEQINGVENMLYMSSYSTSDGSMSLTVTFRTGTDLDKAQVQVQNRVAQAEPRLPEEVRRLGVSTAKSGADLMLVVHMLSPDDSFDQLYISNYALLKVKDQLTRIDGVGNVMLFGLREYSLRIWMDPDKLSGLGLTSGDVIRSLREQNIQVSSGTLGEPPVAGQNAFQLSIATQGRFEEPEQFENVVIKSGDDGRLTRLRDVARVELGARDYVTNSYLNNKPAVALAIFQRPGSNALSIAGDVKETMQEISKTFPKGIEYRIVYNPTDFIQQSIEEVLKTLAEAILLVVLVIILFLHKWRASLIPILTIPVSLVGTFAVMAAFGFSLNMLTLFAMILAIGIVVDDAIVVVENIERYLHEGFSPLEAAHKTMREVGTALIATSLALTAVFVPTAFMPGISGAFYQQFALTLSVATIISTINSLTLSPALGAILLKPHVEGGKSLMQRWGEGFATRFNTLMESTSHAYGGVVAWLVRMRSFVLIFYALCVGGVVMLATTVPTGFIPQVDQGYAITVIKLPDGAALSRTDEVVKKASDIIQATPGVNFAVGFAGFSGATFTNASNGAAIFSGFKPFSERVPHHQTAQKIIDDLQQRLSVIQDAFIITIPPPPVRGVGNAGGFKLMVQDTTAMGLKPLLQSVGGLVGAAWQTPTLTGIYTSFSAETPQVYLDIDRTKAQMLNVPLGNVFEALQDFLGSSYVNDFNMFGRIFQVRAQADQRFRVQPEDIAGLKVRNTDGHLVPLGTLVNVQYTTGPDLIQRYNMYPAIPVSGSAAPGVSSGQAIITMEKLAKDLLPEGVRTEWTELALQEKMTGNTAVIVFVLAIVFVFMVLAAQFESWALPMAILLIVPMSVLSALSGVWLRGMDNNILTQIGLVVLIGLAAKNAILIVEFARQQEEIYGRDPVGAAIEACRLRLRPILMTSLAFILGVLPLVFAHGAGAEMRQAMGTAVFFGMIGVTFFGLLMTPVFYVVLRKLVLRFQKQA